MTAASIVDVDTCPIEGFDPVKYDAYFKLNEQGLRSIVCCAVGYRSSEDKYSLAKKVRFSKDRLVQNI
jgi:nitroreductase